MAATLSTAADQQALRDASTRLRERLRSASERGVLLGAVRRAARIASPAADAVAGRDLEFQGSYTQPTTKEPAYGGHASAMGPPPTEVPRAAVSSPVQFEEVPCLTTKTYCGGRTKDHILESGGSGVAMFDYDGDGPLDIYLVTAFELSDAREKIPHRNALYRNEGGWKFRDVSAGSGLDVAAWGNGVCAGDYDNDGRLDLYVTNFGPNFLFRNNGDGTFTENAVRSRRACRQAGAPAARSSTPTATAISTSMSRATSDASWADLPRAQRTLVVARRAEDDDRPEGLPGEADLFFENRGDGTFVEATEAHGLTDAARAYGFGVVATDYDADGWVDLFVANDTTPNFLYRNRGDGRFESVGTRQRRRAERRRPRAGWHGRRLG